MEKTNTQSPVLFISGAAKRLGAHSAKWFHDNGFRVAIHCNQSTEAASDLAKELNAKVEQSAIVVQASLENIEQIQSAVEEVIEKFGRIDVLINNASSFYPASVEESTEHDWNNLIGSNFKGPFFLTQACVPHLKASQGAIINMVDIHGFRPLDDHSIYSAAKAGLISLTRSLAKELAPEIRVNGVAPGAILWPENEPSKETQEKILAGIPLNRLGHPDDISRTQYFLACEAPYISGQIIAVDGGRSWT